MKVEREGRGVKAKRERGGVKGEGSCGYTAKIVFGSPANIFA